MRWTRWLLLGMLFAALAAPTPTAAFEAAETFQKGTWILSLEGGGGSQENLHSRPDETDFDLWYAGVRVGALPFAPLGGGAVRGSLEIGLEPIYQRYTAGVGAFFAGLALVGRLHFLGLGRVVPYVEVAGAIGGTDLNVREIDSDFTFWLAAGAGASVFVTDRVALYAGYRLVHVSNGGTDDPNRGFEAHTGLAGVSFFFR